MLILADENMPRDCVVALRSQGHGVIRARESLRGLPDAEIPVRAARDGRLTMTFDKDFGELVFRRGGPSSGGVILFRCSTEDAARLRELVLQVIELHSNWSGVFAVVEDDRIRLALPPATP